MTQSQSTKNEQKRRVMILGLGDLGIRLAQTVAERGLATDLKLVSRGEVAAQWAQMLRLGTDCRVSSERTDGLDVAGMTSVLASFKPDLIMQCASLLSPFALLYRCA
jgi:saccharopine dehydrogenase-like NADP-dependent oxidoreductase